MKYTIIPASELTPDLVARWATIQEAEYSLASPYFRPEFTQAVAAVRDDLSVGVLESSTGIVGFFPFHRSWGGVARPVGLGLSDYHGIIAASCPVCTAEELLRGCNLVRWDFDHLPANQLVFSNHLAEISDSPIIDVSHGMAAFEASRDKAGKKQLKEISRKREKLAKQVGRLTFTVHAPEQDILKQLMNWKSEQCLRTGTVDYFSLEWCARLIERIHATRDSEFGGMLSCLHAGDTLAAVHFVMYSRHVWHSWFPAYNHKLEEYSPGFILLLELIDAASREKIAYIDLGKGLSLYKKRVMTGTILVAQGTWKIPSLRNHVRHLRNITEQWSRQSILKPLLRIPGKILNKIERKRRFE